MKQVIIRIRPIVTVTRYDVDSDTNFTMTSKDTVRKTLIGSIWGSELRVYGYAFDLLDSEGYIIFTGSTRDLHSCDLESCNFPGEENISEFEYTPFRHEYV